eukprot:3335885-Pyramimonas_sp.AAC.1
MAQPAQENLHAVEDVVVLRAAHGPRRTATGVACPLSGGPACPSAPFGVALSKENMPKMAARTARVGLCDSSAGSRNTGRNT